MDFLYRCCQIEVGPNGQKQAQDADGKSAKSLNIDGASAALKKYALEVNHAGQIEDYYDMNLGTLGEGSFGRVMKASDKRTDQFCAVKMVPKSNDTDVELQNELTILSSVDHPHIVRFIERFEDRYQNYLVMEFCEGGEITSCIAKDGSPTEPGVANVVYQMLMAVNYLHQHSIAHRDLKPQNWLLKKRVKLEKASLRLIDFGVSKRFSATHLMKTKVGTLNFIAPEILSVAVHYNEKVDTWSIGVLTYLLISGKLPFDGHDFVQMHNQLRSADVKLEGLPWDTVTQHTKPFILRLLNKDPVERISAAHALEHPWLRAREEASHSARLTQLDVGRLSAYSKMHNFKKAAIGVIVTQLDNKKIESLKALFVSMDANRNGTLSPAEMRQAFLSSGAELPEDVEELLRAVDTDSSGEIDYTEFLAATVTKKNYHQRDVVWKAFKKFDKDGSGFIEAGELANVLNNAAVKQAMHLEDEQLMACLQDIDTNGDGIVDFDEFYQMICGKNRASVESGNHRSSVDVGRVPSTQSERPVKSIPSNQSEKPFKSKGCSPRSSRSCK